MANTDALSRLLLGNATVIEDDSIYNLNAIKFPCVLTIQLIQ